MSKIGIVDLPGSNSQGIRSALSRLSVDAEISSEIEHLSKCDGLILPGVGRFGQASAFLKDSGLAQFLEKSHVRGTPILGICLGFQLLFESSQESPGSDGLGLLPGMVSRLREAEDNRVPNIGWRGLSSIGSEFQRLLSTESLLYFAHSYEVKGDFPTENIVTASVGNNQFLAALKKDNLWGAQFHPEKSHDSGLEFMAGFIKEIR